MKLKISCLILLITCSLYPKDVVVDERVHNFINDINASEDTYHRSGLAYEKKDSIPAQAQKSWNNNSKHNYKIIDNNTVTERVKNRLFENNLNKKDFIIKSFNNKSTLLIEKKASPKSSDIIASGYFSKEDYVEIAKSYLSDLNDFKESIEVENVAYETSICSDCDDQFYQQERTSGIYVRFRRIFEGGIVRGNISKILIKLDPDGSIRKLKVIWPEFQKIDKVEVSRSFDENISFVIESLSNNEKASVVSNMTSLSIDSYEITGAAKAWVPAKNEDGIIITPAISYKLNVFLSNDSIAKKILDYPLMTSVLKVYGD